MILTGRRRAFFTNENGEENFLRNQSHPITRETKEGHCRIIARIDDRQRWQVVSWSQNGLPDMTPDVIPKPFCRSEKGR